MVFVESSHTSTREVIWDLSGGVPIGDDLNDKLYNDPPEEMTRGRRIARYLSKYSWYYPRHLYRQVFNTDADDIADSINGDEDIDYPLLDVAWAHFEHIGLPRCFTKQDDGTNTLHRAEPGENDERTTLYPVWGTSLVDMGDFGVGVGLYFSTLQLFAVTMFIAGFINIPVMIYFNSDDYSPDGRPDIDVLLRVSAVCTQMEWQPCPSCTASDWDRFPSSSGDRFATGEASDGSELNFIKVNNCRLDKMFGSSAYLSLIFVIVAVYVINYLQDKKAIQFDEAQQTSTDYSIVIENPPKTTNDPESWKLFFESNFDAPMKVCTIVLNNEKLVKTLVARREFLLTLQNMLPLGKKVNVGNLDETARQCMAVPLWKKLICCSKRPEHIVTCIRQKEDEIVALSKDPNIDVVRVFITFETEAGQRNVLHSLSVPRLKESELREEYRFDGTVLRIGEPDEPISIRWTDLNVSAVKRNMQRVFTMLVSTCIIVAGGVLQALAKGPKLTSFIIIAQSIITPFIVGYLTSFESHPNESSRTASQYFKITTYRWVSTVIIPLVIVPFANTLYDNDNLIKNIQVLFIAELIQRPIIQILGIPGFINRHILGPRAEDQARMNLSFSGDAYNIGERYTDITKILFLTLFYCILYPMAFFFASGIFSIYYWVDKFCILRSWKQGPIIGTEISNMSTFFFKLCLLAYGVLVAYVYGQFPFDNACPSDDDDISAYIGSFNVTLRNGDKETIHNATVVQGYKFCDQEIIRHFKFPPLPSSQKGTGGVWMDNNQETFLYIFGCTSVVVLVLVLGSLVKILFMSYIYPLFFKPYKPHGNAMSKRFQDVKEIAAYVPQVNINGFSFPFLLCEIDNINEEHIGWSPPQGDYENHSLFKDAMSILTPQIESHNFRTNMFSIVKGWDI